MKTTHATTSPAAPQPVRMDRQIERKRWPARRIAVVAVGAALLVSLFAASYTASSAHSAQVQLDQVQLAKVERGMFRDLIPVRATVEPVKTVFVDAVQGGSVAEVLVEEGNSVKAGDVLLRLKNVAFQLQVSSQEAQIAEQLNTNSSVRLQLDQNLLNMKQKLNDTNYSITKLEHSIERTRALFDHKMVSSNAMEVLVDELNYQVGQRKLLEKAIADEKAIREPKMAQLAESESRLRSDARIISNTLDSLLVRSPITGLLTQFKAEVGQIITSGQRIGQVDNVDAFRLKAEIDEFYISRVEAGQKAVYSLEGREHTMVIDRVYPQVTGGKFIVSLAFAGPVPPSVRPGLRIPAQLELGASTNSLLLKRGSAFQDTGGQWVFVTDAQAGKAVRREIQSGRSNADVIEIKGGLKEGERVLISSYANFMNAQEVHIKH
ncbi:efflux RND transporter periplasmic adaptor subunit [Oxalobacteraceae bacterium A2-2]